MRKLLRNGRIRHKLTGIIIRCRIHAAARGNSRIILKRNARRSSKQDSRNCHMHIISNRNLSAEHTEIIDSHMIADMHLRSPVDTRLPADFYITTYLRKPKLL